MKESGTIGKSSVKSPIVWRISVSYTKDNRVLYGGGHTTFPWEAPINCPHLCLPFIRIIQKQSYLEKKINTFPVKIFHFHHLTSELSTSYVRIHHPHSTCIPESPSRHSLAPTTHLPTVSGYASESKMSTVDDKMVQVGTNVLFVGCIQLEVKPHRSPKTNIDFKQAPPKWSKFAFFRSSVQSILCPFSLIWTESKPHTNASDCVSEWMRSPFVFFVQAQMFPGEDWASLVLNFAFQTFSWAVSFSSSSLHRYCWRESYLTDTRY